MSFDIDITLTGADAIIAATERVIAQSGEALRGAVEPFGKHYKAALEAATPQGHGPKKDKRLSESYTVDEHYSATNAGYRITNDTPYVGYVLKGRGPVVAKPGKVLRFEIDGTVYYRHSVGPAAANPFDERVKTQMRGEADGLAEQAAGHLVRLYGGHS